MTGKFLTCFVIAISAVSGSRVPQAESLEVTSLTVRSQSGDVVATIDSRGLVLYRSAEFTETVSVGKELVVGDKKRNGFVQLTGYPNGGASISLMNAPDEAGVSESRVIISNPSFDQPVYIGYTTAKGVQRTIARE
jgi:hypothetical protein